MSNVALEQVPDASAAAEPAPAAVPADVRPVPRISVQAFCETPELAAVVEAAATDRRMARTHVKVHTGGIVAAAEFYQGAATPNLIVVESRLSHERLDRELDRLAEVCDPGTKVVVIGHVNDIELYRELIRRGVSEYLVAPIDVMALIKTVGELYVDRSHQPLGRSIAFVGAKGGVGSSTIAHNVAFAISRSLESDVVVADLDLAFGTAGLDYNQDPAQGIAEAIHAPDRLDETFLERLLARCSDHLSLLAAPATLDRTCDFDEGVFAPLIDIAQSGVPAVVLDLPHVWTGWMRRTLLAADEIVLTVEPDLANLRNAKNLVDYLRQARKHDAPPRLVINKTGMGKRPEIKVDDFAKNLDLPVAATIPFEAYVFGTAANNGQMIAETEAKNPLVETFETVARVVTGRAEVKRQKRSAFGPLFGRFRKKSA